MRIGIITGASSGMGREMVHAIDREYALDELWVVARREDRLRELGESCSTPVRPVPLDLGREESIDALASMLEQEKPQVEILVNAAGYGLFGAFTEMDRKAQTGIVDVNARALTAVCYVVLPYMDRGGKIVNFGSNSSWQPVPYINVYAASKAYVLSFSRGLGRELKPRGIHVMCVCPGWIKTDFFDTAVHDDTIRYYDRFYTAEQVVKQAMKDLRKNKTVSILGLPVRLQVMMVKHLPVKLVMDIWCRQQGKP